MTDHDQMTPPRELVQQWVTEIWHEGTPVRVAASDLHIAAQAARWGGDQELAACCEWLETGPYGFSIESTAPSLTKRLLDARRPKPKSQAEEALTEIEEVEGAMYSAGLGCDFTATRAALERLRELEKQADD
jgi:hypothetical protein